MAWSDMEDVESIPESLSSSADLQSEIALLRSENARLRGKNCFLEQEDMLQKALSEAELMSDLLDNPSEPPPFVYWGDVVSPSCSTGVPSDYGFGSGSATPRSVGSCSQFQSGVATPTALGMPGQPGQVCSMVPVWFAMGDRVGIPCGVVQQARAIFECHKALPSFFVQ